MKEKINDKNLIEFVKEKRSTSRNLTQVFIAYAKQHNLVVGSVRNAYYKAIKNCKTSNKLCQLLGVDSVMFPKIAKAFSESEERDLVKQILKRVTKGGSVRGAIYELSANNDRLALRNQNKYRNAIKRNKQMVSEVILEIKSEYGRCYNPF